jgi:D-glycerate 3-kinase
MSELDDRVTAFCVSALRTKPLFVGITGPQGSGKSTLADAVVLGLAERGLRGIAVSIDDFYRTNAEQRELAARYPGNPYLEHRGYPGTHDVGLGVAVLDALASRVAGTALVPVYDKGAHGGRGDRASASRQVRTPVDVVVLEGWLLGFRAVPPETIDDPHLRAANALLPPYDAWLDRLGALVHLDAEDVHSIVRWRVDAERTRRAETGIGLTDDEARDYIERFLPAYRTYVSALRDSPPVTPHLRITLAEDRLPLPYR